MSTTKHASVPQVLDELAEIERRIRLWNTEAVQLGHSLEAFANALLGDPAQINFRGDLIALDDHPKSSDLASTTVDLAKIRNLVCNLKILQAQRKRLQAQRKFRRAE